ncbi:MAG: hypothetical protein M3340_15865 [Actinomycetota bacterium]|nr:hypothetical protein [Actinomycetota bacterium]
MTPANGESTDQATPATALTTLKDVAGLAGVLSVLLYGFGWLFAARFYGEFQVQPEEAGVTANWLIPRTVVAALPVTLVIFAGYRLTERGRRRSRRRGLVHGAIFMSAVLAAWILWAVAENDVYSAISVVGLAIVEVGGALLAVSWSALESFRGARLACCAVIVTTAALIPLPLAADLADNVRNGLAVETTTLPGVPIANTPRVLAVQRDDRVAPFGRVRCAALLGNANGIYILAVATPKEPAVVWRVPANTLLLREECPGL